MDDAGDTRVLYCSNAYPPRFIGGAELIAEKYARALRAMGYETAVFAGDGQKAWGPRYALRREDWNEVPVWRVQLGHEDFAEKTVNFINRPVEERFEEVLDVFRPTAVHCHNLIGLSVQLLHLAKRRGLRTVLTLHDHWMYCPRNTLMTPQGNLCDPRLACSCQTVLSDQSQHEVPIFLRAGMMRQITSEVDFFHFPSSYLRNVYLLWGLPVEKCRTIPYGIEIERFAKVHRRKQSDRVRLTFVGYVGQHKGIGLLVEAFAGTPENSKLYLNVVGNGELRKPLEARVKELGVADRVRFWKKVPNEQIDQVYEQTDCLVLPSLWPENHPVSINEALASGIPVIGSDSGGIPELVTHCRNGYLFEQGNQAELQRILSHIARNPDCLDILSENAITDVQRLSLQRSIHRIIQLYAPRWKPNASPGAAQLTSSRSAQLSRDTHTHTPRCNEPVHHGNRGEDPGALVSPNTARHLTVASVGKQWDESATNVIRKIESGPLRSTVRILSSDWMYEDEFDDVDLFWIVDAKSPIPSFVESRQNTMVLLPADHSATSAWESRAQAFIYSNETLALLLLETLADLVAQERLQMGRIAA